MRCSGGVFCGLVLVVAATATRAEDDFMSLSLEDLMAMEIGVASRVSRSVDRQPVSVTTVERSQIMASGARTLNELLHLHVPGFFLVEDQDDTIAALRGLAPDNNSKIMLLLDGRNLNADWFWGPPDAVLNGLDLEFIERIEVIRGPGSVTQGQGALLGVINIVTRAGGQQAGHQVAATAGEWGRRGLSWRWRWSGAEGREAGVYLSDGQFDAQPYRNEGLGQQVEQGISVFERNHRLMRGDYRHLLVHFHTGEWRIDGFRFDQLRDLYNWRRDREQVRQVLSGVQLGYRRALSEGQVELEVHRHVDDYELRSHGGTRLGAARQLVPGLILGGHRESRSGARLLWTSDDWVAGHRIAAGGEFNRYQSGQANARGNNFIVNSQEAVLESGIARLNRENRWALPGTQNVRSLFVEDFVALASNWEAFLAARWDSHPDWGSEVTPRLGLLWQQNSHSAWRVSWQSGFRGAVGVNYSGGFEGDGLLREANFRRVEENPFFAANGNRNLQPVKPERTSSFEVAWTLQPAPRWRLNSVAFHNVTRNVIGVGAYFIADDAARAEALATRTRIGDDLIGDWGGVFYFQNNDGELHHRGLEIEAEYRRDELGLLLRLSHAHVRVGKASAGQFGPGNIYVSGTPSDPLSRSFPEDVTRAYTEWRPPSLEGRLSLHGTLIHYPHWYPPVQLAADGSLFTPSLDGNTVVNLGLGYQWRGWPGWSTLLQVKNLGNASNLYPATSVAGEGEGNLGVPGLERRSAWVTVRYQF